METQLERLSKRIEAIENNGTQETLTLIEILSNVAFFGQIKQTTCKHCKNGQCRFFILKESAKDKIPIVTECRVKDCKKAGKHYHLEPSDITCSLCNQSMIFSNSKKVKGNNKLRVE